MVRRLVYFLRRSRRDADLREEIETHRALRQTALERDGVAPEDAAWASRRAVGNVTLAVEEARDVWVVRAVDEIRQDVRLALRALRRDVAFTAFALLVMGLGLGGGATVYSLVTALVLRPLPLPAPDRLAWVGNVADDGVGLWNVQANHLRDLDEQSRTFDGVAGYHTGLGELRLTTPGGTERLTGARVTDTFLPTLGVTPLLGRTFTAAEGRTGGPVVVISHRLWQQRYGLDPVIVGRAITLNGAASTIVGVLPATFDFGALRARPPGGCLRGVPAQRRDQPQRERARRGRTPAVGCRARRGAGRARRSSSGPTVPVGSLGLTVRASLGPLAVDIGGQPRLLGDLLDRATAPRRTLALLLTGFALFALLLASLGVYAVVAVRRQPAGARVRDPAGARRVTGDRPPRCRRGHAAAGGRRSGRGAAGCVDRVAADA